MLVMRRKTTALLALIMGIVGSGTSLRTAGAADKAVTDADLAAWVDQRIEGWRIKPAERPFDAIGWARNIREAEKLAKEHGRPVFLFTLDGRMDVGRC